jgi:hypothetical protein
VHSQQANRQFDPVIVQLINHQILPRAAPNN